MPNASRSLACLAALAVVAGCGADSQPTEPDDGAAGLSDELDSGTSAEALSWWRRKPARPGTPSFGDVTESSVTVTWASAAYATTYEVQRAPDSAGSPGAFATVAASVAGTSITDAALSAATTYWYRVRGTNASGAGSYSTAASVETSVGSTRDPPPPEGTPCSIVSLVPTDASVTAGSVTQMAAAVTTSPSSCAIDTSLTWAMETGYTSGCGSITAGGVYSAPSSATTCRVRATSVADPTRTSSAAVTVTAGQVGGSPGPLLAFSGCQGSGCKVVGGRGGSVHLVTNLNDSGAGSLRACVEASGRRTCVFRVAGVIRLSSGLRVASPYLTVAGQSAPGDGIALNLNNHACGNRVFDLDAGVHDVVIRYLRVWGDYTSNPDPSSCPGSSAVTMWGGSYGVVMDHITALWHSGEAFSQWADQGTSANNGQATVSWSLFGENTMGGSGNPQSTAAIVADSNYDPGTILDFDFHHNVIASTDHRVPLVNGRGRFINNVVQNWVRASTVDSGNNPSGRKSTWDFVGNQWRTGSMQPYSGYTEIMADRGTANLYTSNNISNWHAAQGGESDGGWSLITSYSSSYQGGGGNPGSEAGPAPTGYKRSPWARLPAPASGSDITPVSVSGNSLITALSAAGGVGMSRRLTCDGTWAGVSDAARNRILAYVAAGTGPSSPPSSQTTLGSLPTLATGTACADANGDGIPDAFANAQCGSASCLDGKAQQDSGGGYTWLEKYLNGH